MTIGDRVQTIHGGGTIVGWDLRDCDCRRWIVRIDAPTPEHVATVAAFERRELCYFPREVAKGGTP
jgi:hypothetical protein